MFHSGPIEIPRCFDHAASGEEKVQGGEGVMNAENLDSRVRGKDGGGSPPAVEIVEIPRSFVTAQDMLRAEGCSVRFAHDC